MLRILNARLLDRPGLYRLELDARTCITAIEPIPVETEDTLDGLDLRGDWLSLGGVDLQINGALGLAFPVLTPAALPQVNKVSQLLWSQGVDAYLPTVVTAPVAAMQQALATIAKATTETPTPGQAQILGAHLEGPFLNPDKRGAHPEQYLQSPTLENLHALLGNHGDRLRLMTLAPELDPEGMAIAALRANGTVVSLGHSLATAADAERAFNRGATMVTHAFNAMPGLHHREPGLLGVALARAGTVRCGFIADGHHVCLTMLQLLLRAGLGTQGLFLVSDAVAALGLPDGEYPWGAQTVTVKAGTVRMENGTLAGTTLPLLAGVQNLVRWGLCDPETAIALATTAPREALGLETSLVGRPAPSLLRWSQDPATLELRWQRLG